MTAEHTLSYMCRVGYLHQCDVSRKRQRTHVAVNTLSVNCFYWCITLFTDFV